MKSLFKISIISLLSWNQLSAVTLDAEAIAKKKQEIEQTIQSLKQTKEEIVQKYKEKKKKWKKKFSFLSIQQQLNPADIAFLIQQCQNGSLEAYNIACEYLGVDNIDCVEEALYSLLEPHLEYLEKSPTLSLCGIYIGDDGLEYDDGEEETSSESVSFYSLPLHQWEKKVIEKIITSMAEKSLAQLLLDKKEMEKKGDQIHHVHPLRFMGHAISQTYLKSCMKQFRSNSFKWNNFIDGYSQKMKEMAAADNLIKHLDGFCEFLGLEYEPISDYVQKGQYEALVDYLLQL